VLDKLAHYNRHLRVQPYYNYPSSREAGLAMDKARSGWSRALNIGDDELTIGPSTSINSYVMAEALGADWGVGDEIVITQQDHESNRGVWLRKAKARGATVREWPIDPVSGLLNPKDLALLLNDRTRWVFFSQCSNVIGTVNPVAEIVSGIRRRCSARVCVDAVAYAPHHICDLKALDVDMYLFSLYKVFGPHQGLMYLKSDLQEALPAQSHDFLQGDSHKRFNPAGPQHAQVAACQGVLDYFDLLYTHHDGDVSASPSARMQWLHELFSAHEQRLAAPLLDYLHCAPQLRLLGKHDHADGDRAATITFKPLKQTTDALTSALQAQGIGVECGHFYAQRVLSSLDIDPAEGAVRISLAHYNSEDEVKKILSALELTTRG
jgi:selenocysteine lyase/cysteine desulfurase